MTGALETSLNAPGFSISLCNLSSAAQEASVGVRELLELLDARTAAPWWPNTPVFSAAAKNGATAARTELETQKKAFSEESDIKGTFPSLTGLAARRTDTRQSIPPYWTLPSARVAKLPSRPSLS